MSAFALMPAVRSKVCKTHADRFVIRPNCGVSQSNREAGLVLIVRKQTLASRSGRTTAQATRADTLNDNSERFAQRLEVCYFLPCQLASNLLKAADGFFRVQSFATTQTNLCPCRCHCGVHASAQQFLNILLNHFTTTCRTSTEWQHLPTSFYASQSNAVGQDDRP